MAFKLKIKTDYVDFELEDNVIHDSKGHVDHNVPSTLDIMSIIQKVVDNSLRIMNQKNENEKEAS